MKNKGCFKKGSIPWNKGLTKETDKRVANNAENTRQGVLKRYEDDPTYRDRVSKETKKGMIEKGYTSEVLSKLIKKGYEKPGVKENLSESQKRRFSDPKNIPSYENFGPTSFSWKGGIDAWWHDNAYDLFGKDSCEECFLSNEDHIEVYNQRLHMHCKSLPKDYTIMTVDNWETLCKSCHTKIENIN